MTTEATRAAATADDGPDYLELLRSAADALKGTPGFDERPVFFPNWPFGENELDDPEVTRAIRRAAWAIIARRTEHGDGGRRVSKADIAELLIYVASMLE
jgi:hypothetical protein